MPHCIASCSASSLASSELVMTTCALGMGIVANKAWEEGWIFYGVNPLKITLYVTLD